MPISIGTEILCKLLILAVLGLLLRLKVVLAALKR
jgi:hypothetical protein